MRRPICPRCGYDLSTPYLDDGEQLWQCWQCSSQFRGEHEADISEQLFLDLLKRDPNDDHGR